MGSSQVPSRRSRGRPRWEAVHCTGPNPGNRHTTGLPVVPLRDTHISGGVSSAYRVTVADLGREECGQRNQF